MVASPSSTVSSSRRPLASAAAGTEGYFTSAPSRQGVPSTTAIVAFAYRSSFEFNPERSSSLRLPLGVPSRVLLSRSSPLAGFDFDHPIRALSGSGLPLSPARGLKRSRFSFPALLPEQPPPSEAEAMVTVAAWTLLPSTGTGTDGGRNTVEALLAEPVRYPGRDGRRRWASLAAGAADAGDTGAAVAWVSSILFSLIGASASGRLRICFEGAEFLGDSPCLLMLRIA
mmetsp:Transcript_19362/g.56599  ORF Transcript_19362/g.56599 Transcript_19362/m.56599 type:complete len:228 (+) Transcript_19362:3432-4115(+)